MKACLISQGSVSSKWIAEAMKTYFDEVHHINLKHIEVKFERNKLRIMQKGNPLPKYDCIYIRGSFRYSTLLRAIAAAIENEAYTPISSEGFTIGHDKIINQIVFSLNDVPIPRTYLFSDLTKAKEFLENRSNYPVIIKIPHGTQGKGVLFADSYASASSVLDTLSALRQPFLVQEYVETGGTDIRAIVVGNKVAAAMIRKAKIGEKRSNIHAGGIGKPIVLDEETKHVAIKAAKALGASVCAIDLLPGAKGPLAIEGNLSPGLQGITKATKIDVADEIAKFLFEETKKFLKKKREIATTQVLKDLGIKQTSYESDSSIVYTFKEKNGNLLIPKEIWERCGFGAEDEYEISIRKGELKIKRLPIE